MKRLIAVALSPRQIENRTHRDMTMKHNWQLKLIKYIQHNKHRPFKWGDFDCCLFSADAVLIMTGIDFAEKFRGRYTTKRGATQALKKYGKGTLKETIQQLLGNPQKGINYKRGDICLVDSEQGIAIGIFMNEEVWTTGIHGLINLPETSIIQFWGCELCHQ